MNITKPISAVAPLALLAVVVASGALLMHPRNLHAQSGSSAPLPAVQGRALDTRPESRIEAAQAIDDALAAALIGAISGQFGERKVEVKLDRVETEPVNLIDLKVAGDGRLRIGDDGEWLPLRFGAVYDSVAATVAQPRLTIGDDGEGHDLALSSPLARGLQEQVALRVKDEFAQQPALLRLDRIRELPAGARYARLEGVGAVDFAEQGSSVASVRALYDRAKGEWVQVGYELGSGTAAVDTQASGLH